MKGQKGIVPRWNDSRSKFTRQKESIDASIVERSWRTPAILIILFPGRSISRMSYGTLSVPVPNATNRRITALLQTLTCISLRRETRLLLLVLCFTAIRERIWITGTRKHSLTEYPSGFRRGCPCTEKHLSFNTCGIVYGNFAVCSPAL